jgi:hypothetical protein
MTRKHYVAIAATIRRQYDAAESGEARLAIATLARELCADFKVANRAFDRSRFLTACGLVP